jgi:CubicO group peptidase (beta-lactamase class C family)
MRRMVPTLVLMLTSLSGCSQKAMELPEQNQWPSAAWSESSPEAQGLSSSELARALDFARENDINIHSLTVIRNSVVVLDAYFYPFTAEMRHDVASVTKSIVSLLVGIAVSEGVLEGTAQPALSALPPVLVQNVDRRVERISIGDLLAMQAGFDCGFRSGEPELRAMRESQDWLGFAIGLPMAADPGTRFGYCSPNYHLLSGMIAHAAGLPTIDYARSRLFSRLGIDDVYWPVDPMGINHGWGDLQLRPLDMARIGLLMLRGGRWDDDQILPAEWIEDSLTPRSAANQNDEYGLGWWLSRDVASLYEANGRGGQRIIVLPDSDLVVVMTGGGFEPGDIGSFIAGAIRSGSALPEDPSGKARLEEALRRVASPPAQRMASASPMASEVSGTVYNLQNNSLGIEWFSLEFAETAEAMLRLGLASGTEFVQPLGLDGAYRLTSDMDGAFTAGRAEWMADQRLRIDLNTLTLINRYLLDIGFSDAAAVVVISEGTVLGTVSLDAVARIPSAQP